MACHRWCHSNPAGASAEGLVLGRTVQFPGLWSVRAWFGWVWLDCKGGFEPFVERSEEEFPVEIIYECPDCGGTGVQGTQTRDPQQQRIWDCPACDGSGVVREYEEER